MYGYISVILFLSPIIMVRGEPPAVYGPPNPSHGTSGAGHGSGGGHGGYEEPQSYEFGYRVKDDYSGSSFHQKESSDGNQVRGEYRVALPDGRTQIVTYWADWKTGFHADVKYEGQATYPDNAKKYIPPPGANAGYMYPNPSGQYGAPH
ncbi:pro-resilin [Dendroctonus ponderosae]|uniref:Uncharacterized protein n=1 Tax=Dendroctonus ponderosae TaxID=77166 RepID=U4URB3_DENPD|nr:pro-resilin [Dendroctonus ponderosae]ERL92605.1 hypothetical protein D910_09918 [Dendroctonus ponderosae]KAH1018825.1 hypothetical protein HUJ05_006517 [Dendroctonus ponderosae]